jgi:guanylate kinase
MKKILVFIGESGSGKTTLVTELTKRYPEKFKKVVTCTSRPMRVGEVDGVDYNFLPEEYFADNLTLVLTKRTADGFHYGTRRSDLFSDTHHLLLTSRLSGIGRLSRLGHTNIIAVRMSISPELRIKRMLQRGDSTEEISNRLVVDMTENTTVGLENLPIINLDATQDIDEKIEFVLQAC